MWFVRRTKSGTCACPTQAKIGLEWATRPALQLANGELAGPTLYIIRT